MPHMLPLVARLFVPISVQEMVYLKAIQKNYPMDVSVLGTIDQKTYRKKFRGEIQPPLPSPPCSAYEGVQKSENFKIWLQKSQIGNPDSLLTAPYYRQSWIMTKQ